MELKDGATAALELSEPVDIQKLPGPLEPAGSIPKPELCNAAMPRSGKAAFLSRTTSGRHKG